MKKFLLFTLLAAGLIFQSQAQVLCIMCYDQNDSISTGVNNLLLNGSFENSNCSSGYILDVFCPNSSYYSCDLTNWTCTGGGSQTYVCVFDSLPGTRSTIVDGLYGVYMGNYFCNPCSQTVDDTSCFTMTDCELSGIPPGFPTHDPAYGGSTGVSIEQTVNGLTIGNTYVLEFWVGGENNGTYFLDPGMFGVDVGFGNSLLRCNETPYGTGIGKRYIIEFNANATSHTIKFTSWGHVCSSCTEAVIDQVRLYTIAELNPSIPPCAGSTVSALFTAPNHICPGTCTDFNNLSVNATNFLWSFPGAVPSTSTDVNPTGICYNTPGNYAVSLIASNAIGGDTLTLNNYMTVYPYPAPQGIAQSGDTLFANTGAVTYQWYFSGTLIPGATDYYYVAMQSGDYNVVATDVNNCEVEAAIYDVIAAVSPLSIGEERVVRVYPNPVDDLLKIDHPFLSGENATISIYNMVGALQTIRTQKINAALNYDVHGLESGLFWLEISNGEQTLRTRFMKQ